MVDGVLWEGWMIWNRMGWFLLIMTVSLSILQAVWIRGISFGILNVLDTVTISYFKKGKRDYEEKSNSYMYVFYHAVWHAVGKQYGCESRRGY